jgi:hypothetical protein
VSQLIVFLQEVESKFQSHAQQLQVLDIINLKEINDFVVQHNITLKTLDDNVKGLRNDINVIKKMLARQNAADIKHLRAEVSRLASAHQHRETQDSIVKEPDPGPKTHPLGFRLPWSRGK